VAPSLLNPDVDRELDSIVLKSVQKDSKARFPDANSMKNMIDDYVNKITRRAQAPTVDEKSHSTVEFLLRRIRYKTDFPAISKCITEINRMTSSGSQASVKQLANVILKDYSLTNKLLKLANSPFYRQSGESITSIYKAVVLLGFEQVRLAASSLMLFTHLQGDSATKELQDGMIKSFMSGIIARDLTRKFDTGKTELAFICSLFHDLGKNLTIYYFPEEYAQIKELMIEKGVDLQNAARSVLGISLDELAVGVTRTWEFPENIVYCMRSLPRGSIDPPDSALDTIRHFSVFSNELCQLAASDLQQNQSEPLSRIVKRFERSFPITETGVLELLRSEKNMLQKYASILDINQEQSPFIINLLKFIGADDNSQVTQTSIKDQSLQNSEPGKGKKLSNSSVEPEKKLSTRKKDLAFRSQPEAITLPKRIWHGLVSLFQNPHF
jgi:HD-like signal output (HDOD) protein